MSDKDLLVKFVEYLIKENEHQCGMLIHRMKQANYNIGELEEAMIHRFFKFLADEFIIQMDTAQQYTPSYKITAMGQPRLKDDVGAGLIEEFLTKYGGSSGR